jgi:very-short-patch-repair endonuclease
MPTGIYKRKLKKIVCLVCHNIFTGKIGSKYCNVHKFKYCSKCGRKINRNRFLSSGKCWNCYKKNIVVSKETRKKLSLASKGKPKNHKINCNCGSCKAKRGEFKGKNSPFYRLRLFGNKNPMFGKKTSLNQKISVKRVLKKRWGNIKTKEKIIKKILKSSHNSPNNKEKILITILKIILPNKYRFVGNGKVIIGGRCPDFINEKDKKIIEHFGTYWHNRKGSKQKDKKRLETYKKYGYDTLVIWEHELDNINKVKDKILRFHYQASRRWKRYV